MKKDKIIDRIRKCLRLANNDGATSHEAEAAMRQAQKLMQAHGVEEKDLLAAEALEQRSKASAKERPSGWESNLAGHCARVFGCRVLFSRRFDREKLCITSHWRFVGTGHGPEVAKYGFDVLFRQCKQARKAYSDKTLKRCKAATRIKRADLFCLGWVHEAVGKLATLKPTAEQERAMDAYFQSNGIKPKKLEPNDRSKGKRSGNDILAGQTAGKDASLHHGVGAQNPCKALPGGFRD